MPEVLQDGLPLPSSRTHFDFSQWVDGQAWKFVKREDYQSRTDTFRGNIRRWAKANGLEVECRPFPALEEPNEGELRERRGQRRRDIANWENDKAGDTWSGPNSRNWAGISHDEWQHAKAAAAGGDNEPMDLRRRSEQALERDRRLLAWRDNRQPMTPGTRREALAQWGRGTFDEKGNFSGHRLQPELAARQRKEQQAIRRERRRGRDNLWPRRR